MASPLLVITPLQEAALNAMTKGELHHVERRGWVSAVVGRKDVWNSFLIFYMRSRGWCHVEAGCARITDEGRAMLRFARMQWGAA